MKKVFIIITSFAAIYLLTQLPFAQSIFASMSSQILPLTTAKFNSLDGNDVLTTDGSTNKTKIKDHGESSLNQVAVRELKESTDLKIEALSLKNKEMTKLISEINKKVDDLAQNIKTGNLEFATQSLSEAKTSVNTPDKVVMDTDLEEASPANTQNDDNSKFQLADGAGQSQSIQKQYARVALDGQETEQSTRKLSSANEDFITSTSEENALDKSKSELERRLNQQARLRALAEKMELASLRALTQ